MKVVELLDRRRRNWQELESLCEKMHSGTHLRALPPAVATRFAALYRAACADLALADSYQLPQNTVQYLHRLVGRAHNQLYPSLKFNPAKWGKMLLEEVPQQIFNDRCIQLMFVLFWGVFVLCAFLAYHKSAWPDFAENVMGAEQLAALDAMYKNPIDGTQRDGNANTAMASFYIGHNTSIGLRCFAWGVLVIPGMLMTMFNAVSLGTAFGYMARCDSAGMMTPEGQHFFHFVTAHGPFELTAIVLSAGAGLRLGLAWIMPGDYSRMASLQRNGRKMMPVMAAAMVMFFLAALVEGFLSPSAAPYWFKAGFAILSSTLLTFYFVILGLPRGVTHAT